MAVSSAEIAEKLRENREKRLAFNWALLGHVGWLWPLIMLGVGYAFPGLRQKVGLDTLPSVYGHLLASVIIAVAWLGIQVALVTNRKTPIGSLQFDAALSMILALLITGFGGAKLDAGTLGWWFVVPWVAALIDGFMSPMLAINNAATRRTLQDDVVVS